MPFADEEDTVRCPSVRPGEADCGDEGSAVDEAALIVSRFKERERSLLEGGNGGCSIDCLTSS